MSEVYHNQAQLDAAITPVVAHLVVGPQQCFRLDIPAPSLEAELTYPRRIFTSGGPLGHQSYLRDHTAALYDFRGRLGFPIGLLARVVAHLTARGIGVQIDDVRPFLPQHAPDPSVIDALAGRERELAQAVAANVQGQIEVNPSRIASHIQLLTALFPRAKFAIITATAHAARKLQAQLGPLVGRAGGGKRPGGDRITVTTFTYAHLCEAHVFVIVNAGEAVGEVAMEQISRATWDPARIYTLRHPSLRLGRANELCVESMSGPIIFRTRPEPAAVTVAVCRSRSFPLAVSVHGLERKRQAIWHQDGRNDWVAQLATGFGTGNVQVLQSHGLLLDTVDSDWLRQQPKVKTIIVVESTEHAFQLQRRLPGWRVKTCLPTDDTTTVAGALKTAKASTRKSADVIVTTTYAAQYPIHADVVIRADGGNSPLPLRGFPPPKHARPAGRVMLVDLFDDFDLMGRRDSFSRLFQYQRLGWQVDQVDLRIAELAGVTHPTHSRRYKKDSRLKRRGKRSVASRSEATDLNRYVGADSSPRVKSQESKSHHGRRPVQQNSSTHSLSAALANGSEVKAGAERTMGTTNALLGSDGRQSTHSWNTGSGLDAPKTRQGQKGGTTG